MRIGVAIKGVRMTENVNVRLVRPDEEEDEEPREGKTGEVKVFVRGDKVYQSVRQDILLREKLRNKQEKEKKTRDQQDQFVDKTRQAVAAAGTRDLKADVKRNQKDRQGLKPSPPYS